MKHSLANYLRNNFVDHGTVIFSRNPEFPGDGAWDPRIASSWEESGRAKGAAKGSYGETVVQKGVFGVSVSSLPP